MRTRLMAITLFLVVAVCCITAPSDGDFLITGYEFTGDSTGTSARRGMVSRGPYCMFTLVWQMLDSAKGYEYTLFRSTAPSIQSDPSGARELCTTEDVTWADSEELLWGTRYYYAVMARPSFGDTRWSNEVTVETPGSPFPRPCSLSFVRSGFTDCSLNWTQAEDDFRTYTIVRSSFPGVDQHLWLADTLFVTTLIDSLCFTDQSASAEGTSYYALAVSDTAGLSSFSNEVAFVPGGDIPWRITEERTVYGIEENYYSITGNGEGITASLSFSSYSQARILSTVDGFPLFTVSIHANSLFELSDGTMALSYVSSMGNRFAIFKGDLSAEMNSRSFPPVHSVAGTEAGLLLGCSSVSAIVNMETLETIKDFDFGFDRFAESPDGTSLYLLNSSGVLVLNILTATVTGAIPGNYSDVRVGADGMIRCVNSQRVDAYDPFSLTMTSQFVFPQPAAQPEVTLLPPQFIIAYVPVLDDGVIVFRLWDTVSGESPGRVVPQHGDYIDVRDIVVSPDGDFLWGLSTEADMQRTAFRISL